MQVPALWAQGNFAWEISRPYERRRLIRAAIESVATVGLCALGLRAPSAPVGSRADYERMGAFIVAHHLHPVIDPVFPLAQYQEASDYMTSGSFFGKIMIQWR
jgi:NADPH:quinone reductase-like Zn-dependent oxidoreductase